ncbi:MAG TPA: hypothetical protein VHV55_14595 [Pirellulales bacterium]|jgi:hypothetical protein|nr:hypothetical protein [Pirellulales bacterium]
MEFHDVNTLPVSVDQLQQDRSSYLESFYGMRALQPLHHGRLVFEGARTAWTTSPCRERFAGHLEVHGRPESTDVWIHQVENRKDATLPVVLILGLGGSGKTSLAGAGCFALLGEHAVTPTIQAQTCKTADALTAWITSIDATFSQLRNNPAIPMLVRTRLERLAGRREPTSPITINMPLCMKIFGGGLSTGGGSISGWSRVPAELVGDQRLSLDTEPEWDPVYADAGRLVTDYFNESPDANSEGR